MLYRPAERIPRSANGKYEPSIPSSLRRICAGIMDVPKSSSNVSWTMIGDSLGLKPGRSTDGGLYSGVLVFGLYDDSPFVGLVRVDGDECDSDSEFSASVSARVVLLECVSVLLNLYGAFVVSFGREIRCF
jgi:hypothetical protein